LPVSATERMRRIKTVVIASGLTGENYPAD
jgi:hypothetical protein